MKKSNMHRALYDAVSDIDPALLDDVTAPRTLVPTLVKVAAVAAVLALLLTTLLWPTTEERYITCPGILSITVHAMDAESKQIVSDELKPGVSANCNHYWSLVMGAFPGLPLRLSLDTEDFPAESIVYDVKVNCGEFIDWGNTGNNINPVGTEFTISNDCGIYWKRGNDFESNAAYDHVYTEILIRCEEHIVGYAVVRFDRIYSQELRTLNPQLAAYYPKDDQPTDAYHMVLLESVIFPKTNGAYQEITREYVQAQMDQIHSERGNATG